MQTIHKIFGWMLEVEQNQVRFQIWEASDLNGSSINIYESESSFMAFHGFDSRPLEDVCLLIENNPDNFKQLSGVFSIAFISKYNNSVYIACDRLGIQAVYYTRSKTGGFIISTHLMWLLLKTNKGVEIDSEGWWDQFGFGYSVDPAHLIYDGVYRLPPACYARIDLPNFHIERYWREPEPLEDILNLHQVSELRDSLCKDIFSLKAEDTTIGLTSGKDSLCISSALPNEWKTNSATFGADNCSDRLQGKAIARYSGYFHNEIGLCNASDFRGWVEFVSFHSAGLATASYVDMARFTNLVIPSTGVFVIGEGGECIRPFFSDGKENPLEKLYSTYLTPQEYLYASLNQDQLAGYENYPNILIDRARQIVNARTDIEFAQRFYRQIRMPGNFSVRNAVLSPLCNKLSPFLNNDFMDTAYQFSVSTYKESGIHRAIIQCAKPDLLHFFDHPVDSTIITQEWPSRFANGIGREVFLILEENLKYVGDIINKDKTLFLCQNTIKNPSRAIYYLFRLVSWSTSQKILKSERSAHLLLIQKNEKLIYTNN